jgi:hypothetical protein
MTYIVKMREEAAVARTLSRSESAAEERAEVRERERSSGSPHFLKEAHGLSREWG